MPVPFLSVIIPVYRVQAFLEECLDSVLRQDFDDFEVIAVDDCSPDHSPQILDRYARDEARLQVLHLEQNVGLGPARNAGLEKATGEYVLFLDSDDSLTPGTLKRIAHKIRNSGDPEVVLLDHARTYWTGRVQRNIRHDVLQRLSSAPFVAEGHPEIFQLLQVAWNKVCRRDFLLREGLTFPPGYYEDTLWTHQGILTARSIAALPHVCVHYRQRRHGSILGSASHRHIEAFDQWQRVFDFLQTRPDLAHWEPLLSERMAGHYLTVLRQGHRLLEADRPEFFRRASEQLRRYGSPEAAHPKTRADALLHRLLYQGDFRLFQAVKQAQVVRRRVARVQRRAAHLSTRTGSKVRTAGALLEYRALQEQPLDPHLAVYASLWNRGVAGNPKAIYDAMLEVAPHVEGVWIIRRSQLDSVPDGIDAIVPGTRRYWQTMARATYFVNDVNFPDRLTKRPGQVHVQTQHGTPLKHMGLDLMAHPAASRNMDFAKLLRRSDRWDYNLSSNTYSTLIWEKAFPCSFTTLEYGYPRNDVLVRAGADEVAAARSALGLQEGQRAVLYAPTHREYDPTFLMRLDLGRLARRLGPDVVLLARSHYFYGETADPVDISERAGVVDVSRHRDVAQLMLAADVLVTDYSSIMFDYANLGRPIVVYAPDWSTYRDVRGTYFDLLAEPPGAVARTEDELAAVLTDGSSTGAAATSALAAFRERFCEFDDGHAGERVARKVFLSEQARLLDGEAHPCR